MKLAKACQQCRASKRRCVAGLAGQQPHCAGCQQRGLLCSLALKTTRTCPRKLISIPPFAQEPERTTDRSAHLSFEAVIQYVDLYFRFVHDRPHSLFHERSLRSSIHQGVVEEQLLAAICAIGCRFSSDPSHSNLSGPLKSKSSTLLALHLEEISLANIQTCVLLANLCAAERDNALEALYFGIANRMAYVLRLHESSAEHDPILQEVKCRVWWSLFMADRWCPPALGLPREIMHFDQERELPMEERAFQQMDENAERGQNADQRDSMWKHMIKLADILGPIQDLNLSLLSNVPYRSYIDQQVESLLQRLKSWHNTLPNHLVLNNANLDAHRAHGHGGTFVALHLGYYHYSTLLLFQYLDDTTPSRSDKNTHYSEECRHHALSFSKLLHHARLQNDCHVVYLTVAYMTMVSSSVLVHMLLFGDPDEVETARVQLTQNFEVLMELKRYWPHVDTVIQRLLTFQNACLRAPSIGTHRVDGWMVRFLLEHALPFAEKDTYQSPDAATSSAISDTLLERQDILTNVFEGWH